MSKNQSSVLRKTTKENVCSNNKLDVPKIVKKIFKISSDLPSIEEPLLKRKKSASTVRKDNKS